jgi:hypothetical protein
VFFADLPRPDDDFPPPEVHYDHPGNLPAHWLPGTCDVHAVIARTHDTAITLRVGGCYPRGLELEVRAHTAPPDPQTSRERAWRHQAWEGHDLRIGLRRPDGSRVEAGAGRRDWGISFPSDAEDERTTFSLDMNGGSGGGLSYDFSFWLHPLPPAGPVEVFVRWDSRDVPETSVTLDLTPAVVAAADAEELWHLPTFEERPPEGGWFAYAPLGTGSSAYGSTLTFTSHGDAPDDGSGDALDGQDQDG